MTRHESFTWTDSDPLPDVPGKIEGVVGINPLRLQCRECGVIAEHPRDLMNILICTSGLQFHARPWTSGHTDNPRLCRDCRAARGCTCEVCQDERRAYGQGRAGRRPAEATKPVDSRDLSTPNRYAEGASNEARPAGNGALTNGLSRSHDG